jgi:lon-related putative ATP-dependent protease
MSSEHLKVPLDQLTRVCNPETFSFTNTDEIAPLTDTIGQDRAVSAIELALDIDADGFNLYVAGIAGTGRTTALAEQLKRIGREKPIPTDWGYVHNFQDPSQPVAICVPCGNMRQLAVDMEELVSTCKREIPNAFESDEHTHRVEEVMQGIQEERQKLTTELENEARRQGFSLQSTQVGITPVPLLGDRPMTQEEFTGLSDADRENLRRRAETVQHAINHLLQELRRLGKEASDKTREVDVELVKFTLTPIIDELQKKYADCADIVSYLDHVQSDMVHNLDIFKQSEEQGPAMLLGGGPMPREEDPFIKYRVNDLVDNSSCVGAPVIFEYSPTYYNLFGRIDYKARVGTFTTDLTMIKPGAVHRANGGYLVLQVRDLLTSPLSWETLKRTLRSGECRIENIGEQYSSIPSATLRPQPIPVNTKILLVGGPDLLRLLEIYDEDFRRYFKVIADFDSVMVRSDENMQQYASFVKTICVKQSLRPFDRSAVACVIDYSSRLVEDQNKLSTNFMTVADMLAEANYWAGKSGSGTVAGEHVRQAIEQKRYRSGLTEERIREYIQQGTIHIDTEGARVGEVNGLAVYSLGDYAFGSPSRITAKTSLGRGQVVNIERETQMSGKIHNKGFMILTGYLQSKYGQEKPLSLSASIGFEQTYSEVDGDSASSTELYALLSAVSGLPISQNIAVTGSVNQSGDVQAIGGATYKIEGFFDVCKVKGLTGTQGVMIPKDNIRNLVLRHDVVEAVREGRFHIYAVSTIDEGIEVLTGVPAGTPDETGAYPEDSVHGRVLSELENMAEKVRAFGRDRNGSNNQQRERDEQSADEGEDKDKLPTPEEGV